MRMTIPKSQGKQPYYDARKAGWGDLFPHEPKNRPQERFVPETSTDGRPRKGQDIGKHSTRGDKKREKQASKHSYSGLAKELKEKAFQERKSSRRLKERDSDDMMLADATE